MAGIGLKILFDFLSERAKARRESQQHALPLRREAYDAFLEAERRERAYVKKLDELYRRHLAGQTEISEDEQNSFPPSPMPDLVAALERIERVAGDQAVISAARNIVRLFGDMATASVA
jgi:hypothetical protein